MSSMNRDSYYFFPCNTAVFYFFFFFNCPGGTSNTMMNRSNNNGHPGPVPDFREKAYNLSNISKMLAVGFFMHALIMMRNCL